MADHQPAHSAPCHLRRIKAPDDVWRCHTLALWPALFRGTILAEEWSWIGRDGTVMRQHFADAGLVPNRFAKSKVRRDYRFAGRQGRRAARSETLPIDVTSLVPRRLRGSS